jgi:hypothetical protein
MKVGKLGNKGFLYLVGKTDHQGNKENHPFFIAWEKFL